MYECHVIIDLEFNPVLPEHRDLLRDEIIEIGAVKLNPRFEEIGRFSCLVRPELNTQVEPVITKLTTIRTADVMNAVPFSEALRMLSEWVGPAAARIYSWSENDLNQLTRECGVKGISLPENMHRWMDLQKVFQRVIHYPHRSCLALSGAADMLELSFDRSSAHRALYDALVTADILKTVKSEAYAESLARAREHFSTERRSSTYSLGAACGDALAELLQRLAPN